ncbi:MAG: hypothetical protein WA160_11050 [Pseudobdellovibrio sp.]
MAVLSKITDAGSENQILATYEVPVTEDANLQDLNQFKIKNISLEKTSDGTTNLKYEVPRELTGKSNLVQFVGKLDSSGSGFLAYEENTMNCQNHETELECNVSYGHLIIDQDLASLFIDARFPTEQLNKRMQVQEKFSTDLIGILHIQKAPIPAAKNF